ncbi:MAG TPA: hypothetical protein VEC18_02445 [Myxococcota bacterium]|nr:hypothetical protein [Myxococcota bacterium]
MRFAVRAITVATAILYLSGLGSLCPTPLVDARGSREARAHAGHDAHAGEERAAPRATAADAQPDASLLARCGCSCSRDEKATAAGSSSGSALLANAALTVPQLEIAYARSAEPRLAREAPRAIDHVPLSALRA